MNRDELRQIVRDVLAEEIARVRRDRDGAAGAPRPRIREEVVSIRSDMELGQFVRRLAEILKDGRNRDEIEQGRWVFRLAPGSAAAQAAPALPHHGAGAAPPPAAPAAAAATIDRGIVSERQIEGLPSGTSRLVVGKTVRFTPLARDRLRVRGIEIERTG
ncbi:MAG: hypothetical protein R3D57_17160 [Hyphomicrobiaceae bacterium]